MFLFSFLFADSGPVYDFAADRRAFVQGARFESMCNRSRGAPSHTRFDMIGAQQQISIIAFHRKVALQPVNRRMAETRFFNNGSRTNKHRGRIKSVYLSHIEPQQYLAQRKTNLSFRRNFLKKSAYPGVPAPVMWLEHVVSSARALVTSMIYILQLIIA